MVIMIMHLSVKGRLVGQNQGDLDRDVDCFWDSHTNEAVPGTPCPPTPTPGQFKISVNAV